MLFIVIFLFSTLQWFQYHTLCCSLYDYRVKRLQWLHHCTLCCSLYSFCFQGCRDSNTIHCVVHCTITVSEIPMIAPLHIVLFILSSVFKIAIIPVPYILFSWYYYRINDCNDCTTTHCIAHCNLSVFKIAMIPIPYSVMFIVFYCKQILQWLHHYTSCCSL